MLARVLDCVYPPKCGLCGRMGQTAICPLCRREFQELNHRVSQGSLDVIALFDYEGRAAQAVKRLKYSRATSLAGPLAVIVKEAYEQFGLEEYDLVVPIPIHWRRRCHRGFNQAELLASQLPRVSPGCLKRIRFTRPQVGLNKDQRINNLSGAFKASGVEGRSVLLVDDVTTTGHTAQQCAEALLEAGAARVGLLALTAEL